MLELREEHEQARARELAQAQDAADAAKRTQDELAALRASSKASIDATVSEAPRIGHLQQLGLVLESLDERVASAAEQVTTAEGVVTQAQGALADAARDRRILDRLKAKHAENFRLDEAQKERLHMDEIALSRFGRSRDVCASYGANDDANHSDSTSSGGNGSAT